MTSKKRKYGDLSARALPSEDPSLLDDVFAAFTGKRTQGEEQNEITSTPVTPVTPVTRVRAVTRDKTDAAPKRDFTRAANSVVRDAIPAGVFTGKGKQLYDYLYSRTRGAIVPVKSTRIPTEQVMAGANMTRNTFRFQMERLTNAGLVQVELRPGEHGGNLYTVFLPEEVGIGRGHTGDRGDRGQQGHTGQNLQGVAGSEIDPGEQGLNIDGYVTSSSPKTFNKTKDLNTDDEAFAGLNDLFKQAVINLTGKSPTPTERDRWRELAELLVAELQIAAARTGQVSNVPAFLTEHLRRRLWKKDKAQLEREAKEATSEPDPKQGINASKCPDCGGSGWWYPEGVERGVAKCKHQRLPVQ